MEYIAVELVAKISVGGKDKGLLRTMKTHVHKLQRGSQCCEFKPCGWVSSIC